MDTFSLLFSAPSPKVEKTIEVNLEDLEQFFNTMDPSPFHEKDLDHDLEEFIVSWATEYSLHDPLRLVVYLQNRPAGTDAQSVIERAVHNYFAYRTGLNQREFKQLLREGRISLLIGLLFLTGCLSGGQMASRLDIPWRQHCGDKSNDRRLGSDVASSQAHEFLFAQGWDKYHDRFFTRCYVQEGEDAYNKAANAQQKHVDESTSS